MNKLTYVQPADSRLPASFQGVNDPAATDPRLELYGLYAMPHESFEDFCDRSAEDYGLNWVSRLIGKTIKVLSRP